MFDPQKHRVVVAWPCRGKRATRFIRRARRVRPSFGAEMLMQEAVLSGAAASRETRGAPVSNRKQPIHPLIVRITHWINAVAIVMMIMSGLQIHNAYPIVPIVFPAWLTLGDWLGGALLWHFAAMWILIGSFAVYLGYGLASGRLRNKLLPVSPREVFADVRNALVGKLAHDTLTKYNAAQKLLYSGVLAMIALVILSGIALWKPVQFQSLAFLLGGFEGARIVHFVCMAAISGFLVIHVLMAVLVPKSLRAMLRGY